MAISSPALKRTLGIMQPYLFPYLGYYQLAAAVDKFIFLDDVNFIKAGWINRNRFYSTQGPVYFTVPLIKASQNRLICEIQIQPNDGWQEKILKGFVQTYKKAPHYEAVYPLFADLIKKDVPSIGDLAALSVRKVMEYLGLPFSWSYSSYYQVADIKGAAKIINLCEQEKATHYLNPIGGTSLYSEMSFQARGMDLSFIRTNPISYSHLNGVNTEGLSILDVLLFNSIDETRDLLKRFQAKHLADLEPELVISQLEVRL